MPEIVRTAPVRPPPPQPEPVVDRLCAVLEPEVKQGLVTVDCKPPYPLVRLKNRGMFASGSATIDPRFVPLLNRLGAALKEEPGTIEVIGYTDNQPIKTVQFPSNYHLSAARAEAARVGARARARRSGAALGGRARRIRSAEPERDTGGARAEPADRDRPAPAGMTGRRLGRG